jgi:hypothetical protein
MLHSLLSVQILPRLQCGCGTGEQLSFFFCRVQAPGTYSVCASAIIFDELSESMRYHIY